VIKISDRKDKMSSLSDEWREAVTKDNPNYAGMWKRELTVPAVTLDALIQRYGTPDYIKIDVEGHEEQVLAGLSILPPLLSFEFNRLMLGPVLRILKSTPFNGSSFNYTLIDPIKFESKSWVAQDQLIAMLLGLHERAGLGDIFVRRNSAVT